MNTARQRPTRRAAATSAALAGCLLTIVAATAVAGPREQAKRMHDRLVGTPPSDTVLNQMEADIAGGSALNAALRAIDPMNPTSSPFYSVTLKNFATPWTNRDQTVFAPLNDYTATVIGMIPVGESISLMGAAFLGEKRIQGSLMGSNRFPVDMPRLVDAYMAGKLHLDDMISRRIRLDQVNEAFEEMKTGAVARSVIVFDT